MELYYTQLDSLRRGTTNYVQLKLALKLHTFGETTKHLVTSARLTGGFRI